MASLRGKLGRILALLALIAGLVAPMAAPLQPAHAAPPGAAAEMDCAAMQHGTPAPQPKQHLPAGVECCIANICAMALALPIAPMALASPQHFELRDYALLPSAHPSGVDSAPIPHPPKPDA